MVVIVALVGVAVIVVVVMVVDMIVLRIHVIVCRGQLLLCVCCDRILLMNGSTNACALTYYFNSIYIIVTANSYQYRT